MKNKEYNITNNLMTLLIKLKSVHSFALYGKIKDMITITQDNFGDSVQHQTREDINKK